MASSRTQRTLTRRPNGVPNEVTERNPGGMPAGASRFERPFLRPASAARTDGSCWIKAARKDENGGQRGSTFPSEPSTAPSGAASVLARTSAFVTRARETGSTAAAEFPELVWNIESISAPASEARSVAERWASERVRDCVSCKSIASHVTRAHRTSPTATPKTFRIQLGPMPRASARARSGFRSGGGFLQTLGAEPVLSVCIHRAVHGFVQLIACVGPNLTQPSHCFARILQTAGAAGVLEFVERGEQRLRA